MIMEFPMESLVSWHETTLEIYFAIYWSSHFVKVWIYSMPLKHSLKLNIKTKLLQSNNAQHLK